MPWISTELPEIGQVFDDADMLQITLGDCGRLDLTEQEAASLLENLSAALTDLRRKRQLRNEGSLV